jgi:transcriptional regulator with XRE-family HTH domain
MLTIGEAMKKARLDKGFSIMQLSIKAGIGKHNIYHWENGVTFPSIINLIPIADALNISLDELVGRTVKG